MINKINKNSSLNSISVDNISSNYFKHLLQNFCKEIKTLDNKQHLSSQIDIQKLKEVNISKSQEYSVFRIKMIEVFQQKDREYDIGFYQKLVKEVFTLLNSQEEQFNKIYHSEESRKFYEK